MFSFLRSKPKLTPEEESDEILKLAHYKQRILGTSAYEESSDYELLHSKVRELIRSLLARHRSMLVPSEVERAIHQNLHDFFQEEDGVWRVRRDLDIAGCEAPIVMALAFLSYQGGDVIEGLRISQNRFFTNRAIEFLIAESAYAPATLAKALLLMYGFQEYLPPQVEEARAAFLRYGYSDRSIQHEISSLPNLAKLALLKPKSGSHASQSWREHSVLQELVRQYHPANRNG